MSKRMTVEDALNEIREFNHKEAAKVIQKELTNNRITLEADLVYQRELEEEIERLREIEWRMEELEK